MRALERRDLAALVARSGAALAVREAVGLGSGVPADETLAALPWLADVPLADLARAALRAYQPGFDRSLSVRSQRKLEVAVERLDRYANFGRGGEGVGREMLLRFCAGPPPPWDGAGPCRTLGGVAIALNGLARKWRQTHRRKGQR